ncbi:MAG: hypothetical protein M3Q97_03080 [Bacteroidota bacterium]|nr:hypothetical protein [Bacteroidota bacterium]
MQQVGDTLNAFTNTGLIVAYILLIAALLLVLGFVIYQMYNEPRQGKRTVVAVGTLLIIYMLCFAFSSSGDALQESKNAGLGTLASRLIGAGLLTFYILFGGALAAIVVSEIYTSRN